MENRVPPGQVLTRKFPVTGEISSGQQLTPENYRLTLSNGTETEEWTLDRILSLPSEHHTVDIHCVTGWSRLDTGYRGIRFSKLLEAGKVNPAPGQRFVRFEAYSSRSHDTSLPLELAMSDSWLVFEIDGKPLDPAHGYPLRLFTPSRYFYKSLKWVRLIEFMESDRLGFWERTSCYHNDGLPWEEQRFTDAAASHPDELRKLREADDFTAFRAGSEGHRVFLKASMDQWSPISRDLSKLHIKASTFRNADLRGIDFTDANLTLCRFPGADLTGAQFIRTDLEGADFTGANLTGAVFHETPLSATRFFSSKGNKVQGLTAWNGLAISSPSGLLESQKEYLNSLGVVIR